MRSFHVVLLLFTGVLTLSSCWKADGPASQGSADSQAPQLPERGALVDASARGDYDLAYSLIRRGADVNENVGTAEDSITPLIAATAKGRDRVVALLLQNGADVQASYQGYSSVDLAIFLDDPGVLRNFPSAGMPGGLIEDDEATGEAAASED